MVDLQEKGNRGELKQVKEAILARRNTRQRGVLHYNGNWEKYKNGYLKN